MTRTFPRSGVIVFLAVLALCAFAGFSGAQEKNNVNLGVEVRAIPAVATLGQEIRLVIQTERPKGFSLEPLSKDLKLPPFEVRSVEKLPVSPRGNRVIETMVVRLAVYDLGDVEIPPMALAVWNIAGQRAEARTPPIPVRIMEVPKKKTDKNDIRPIKGPAKYNLSYLRDTALGLLAALLTACLIWKILKRKKIFSDPESLLPPADRAERELIRLIEERYLEAGKAKEFYTGLSDIFRRYLERSFTIQALELTTPEVMVNLREKSFDPDLRQSAGNFLAECDLVKFAKHEPERTLSEKLCKDLREFIQKTRPQEPEEKGKKP